jgi:hypothetical protein
MYRGVFCSLVVSAAVALAGASGATAGPQSGGCAAFGGFMGWSAPNSAHNEHPLGQVIRNDTPFGPTLEQYKTSRCG